MKSSTVKWRLIGALFFFVLTGSSALSQVQTAKYITIGSNVHAFYEYLPQGYSSSGSYPLIIFLHGLGELGAGNSSTLPKVANNGLPRLIREGKFPTSFTVNGATHRFIVLSPQFVAWPSAKDVSDVIEYAIRTYRVNQQRIYVTGLSMGGGATWGIASDATYNKRLAAIVPVCGALYPAVARTNVVADAKIPAWATHNNGDPTVSVDWTNDWVSQIKNRNSGADIKKSIFNAASHDAWSHTYDPNFRENGVDIYEWMLQHQLGTPPPTQTPNQAPTADAGGNKNLTLPTNSVQLIGKGTDPDGTIASYLWTKQSGPATGVISSATVSNPTLSQLVEGTYVYQLTVTDNKGAKATSKANIVVSAAANKAPSADAGGNKYLTLPTNSVQLNGKGTDTDGNIASYLWSKISGPANGVISSTTIPNPTLSQLVAGTYVYQLTVTDNKGAKASNQASIVVSAAANKAPSADAGGNKAITLPTNSVKLSGKGSDPDGRIAAYAWTKISGPAAGTISSTTVPDPTLSQLVAGTYVYQLEVTDDKGARANNRANIVVSPAPAGNKAPTANAGADRIVTAPLSTTTLTGSGTDADGSITTYAWTKISGPTGGYVSSPYSTSTAVNALTIGTYVYELKVTDNKGASATDQVNVVVRNTTPGGSQPGDPAPAVKYVNVRIYGGINPFNNSQWNNWNVVTAPGNNASINVNSGNFKYSDGSTSPIKAVLSHSQQIRDNGANYVTGQMAPTEVLRYLSYSSIPRTLKITGLSASKKYTVNLYSSRNVAGYFTTFKVNGVNQVINTYNNATSKASFANLTPDSKGAIVVVIDKNNIWNYLNGFTVVESGTSTTSAKVAASSTVEEAEANITSGKLIFETYPNPVVNQLQVKLSNRHTGQLVIKVFDRNGALMQEVRTAKNQDLMQVMVPFEKLGTGTYFVRCTIGDWSETKQVVKIK